MAHASKFVRPGSVRIASNLTDDLSNVAFITPAKEKVLIVANTSNAVQTFDIIYHNRNVTAVLQPRSVATYTWK